MKKIKRILSIVILISFFLPLAQCKQINFQQTKQTQVISNDQRIIQPSKTFKINDTEQWFLLLIFCWPLLIILLQELKFTILSKLSTITAPFFGVATIFYIAQIFRVAQPLYGGYIWLSSVTIFTLLCASDLAQLIRRSKY